MSEDNDRTERAKAASETLGSLTDPLEDAPSGKRAASVATIINTLIEAGEGVPLPTSFLLEEADSDVSQMGPCFLALELVGFTQRHQYDSGGRKPGVAYSVREGVLEDD